MIFKFKGNYLSNIQFFSRLKKKLEVRQKAKDKRKEILPRPKSHSE